MSELLHQSPMDYTKHTNFVFSIESEVNNHVYCSRNTHEHLVFLDISTEYIEKKVVHPPVHTFVRFRSIESSFTFEQRIGMIIDNS